MEELEAGKLGRSRVVLEVCTSYAGLELHDMGGSLFLA